MTYINKYSQDELRAYYEIIIRALEGNCIKELNLKFNEYEISSIGTMANDIIFIFIRRDKFENRGFISINKMDNQFYLKSTNTEEDDIDIIIPSLILNLV